MTNEETQAKIEELKAEIKAIGEEHEAQSVENEELQDELENLRDKLKGLRGGTPRLNGLDVEKVQNMAGYGESDVVISASLFDELIAQYPLSAEAGTGLSPNERVRRA